MKWYVYRHDFNDRNIKKYNVFSHYYFSEEVEKLRSKKNKISFDEFKERLESIARYYFWSKCEHEIILTSFPPYIVATQVEKLIKAKKEIEDKYGHTPKILSVNLEIGEKIDVFNQLFLNWDIFVSYVYNYEGG